MSGADKPKDPDGAVLRLTVIGGLLSSPPPKGGLQAAIKRLSETDWTDLDGRTRRFAASTIEGWHCKALNGGSDVMAPLRRRRRRDAGSRRSVSEPLLAALAEQHRDWPWWSVELHHRNLAAKAAADPALGTVPSYSTLRRVMRERGMRRRRRDGKGGAGAADRLTCEVTHTNGLWHADFHHGRCRVAGRDGVLRTPILFAAIDDHSRILCHAQWYPAETAEAFAHGLRQAFQKMGLPRALMTDNGSAMKSSEVQSGLRDLGIHFSPTPPGQPQGNGKIEHFWAALESRLVAMVDPDSPPDLAQLNDWTQAWIAADCHARTHREIRATPLERLQSSPGRGRPCPEPARLRFAFQTRISRTQRLSDHTVAVGRVRYQVPPQWHHMDRLALRCARWDLSRVDLVDPGRPHVSLGVLRPVDPGRNAARPRRRAARPEPEPQGPRPMAPYLERMLQDRQDRGGVAPWLPFDGEDAPPRAPSAAFDRRGDSLPGGSLPEEAAGAAEPAPPGRRRGGRGSKGIKDSA